MVSVSELFHSLSSSLAGRSGVGKVLLLLGLAACVYQFWRRWYTRQLVSRKFRGKVVLITGASSGLGEALARVFYAVGSKVILASRNVQQLEQLKFQLDNFQLDDKKKGVRYSPKILSLDLSEAGTLAGKCEEALGLYGRVDILVNNAGISSRGRVMDTSIEVDRKVMEVNFFGTVALTKGLLPSMLEHGEGTVVVISSIQGKVGLPSRSSYAASKHALQGYFDSLRCELASKGIHVLVVSPGYISTQLSVNAVSADGTKHGVMDATTAKGFSPGKVAQAVVEGVACGRREVVPAKPTHQLVPYLRVLWPSLLDSILRWKESH